MIGPRINSRRFPYSTVEYDHNSATVMAVVSLYIYRIYAGSSALKTSRNVVKSTTNMKYGHLFILSNLENNVEDGNKIKKQIIPTD